MNMKMSFRWYGEDDPISLQYISQGYDHNSYKDNSIVSCAQKITVIYVVIGTYII